MIDKYKVVSNNKSLFFFVEHSMQHNQLYNGDVPKNIEPRKWWHYASVKIIFMSFIILTISTVTLSFMLKFVIFAPEKPETLTIQQPGKIYSNAP